MSRTLARLQLRPYEEGDQAAVLDLLDVALGPGPAGTRSPRFFRWKHFDNPFGRSYLLVAEADARIVGLRAFMRWMFVAEGRPYRAVRAVDTATHPDYQGRGVFSALTRRAIADLRDEVDFIFNTPNERSLPGYLKMGWQVVGRLPIYVRVRRPITFLRSARSWKRTGPHEATVLPDGGAPEPSALAATRLEDLASDGDRSPGFHTQRSRPYLAWRYSGSPLGYQTLPDGAGDDLKGLAVFRIRPRGRLVEATVSELLTAANDRRTARRLLSRLARTAPADHVSCSFPRSSVAVSAARRTGFIRLPVGVTLTVNRLGHHVEPDPSDVRSWALSLGDVEVF